MKVTNLQSLCGKDEKHVDFPWEKYSTFLQTLGIDLSASPKQAYISVHVRLCVGIMHALRARPPSSMHGRLDMQGMTQARSPDAHIGSAVGMMCWCSRPAASMQARGAQQTSRQGKYLAYHHPTPYASS